MAARMVGIGDGTRSGVPEKLAPESGKEQGRDATALHSDAEGKPQTGETPADFACQGGKVDLLSRGTVHLDEASHA